METRLVLNATAKSMVLIKTKPVLSSYCELLSSPVVSNVSPTSAL